MPATSPLLKSAWSGLLQAAFKHQIIVQGVGGACYLRRPDIVLPLPPIETIDVPPELVANLRDVYGIDEAGNLYVLGPESKVEALGERKVITIAGIGHGEAEEDDAYIDHELGSFFHGNIALAPDGRVLAVSNTPSFYMFMPDGETIVSHHMLRSGAWRFEPPPAGVTPFWEAGAGDVAAGPVGFVIGGEPLYRIDHYGYDGTLRCCIQRFELDGRAYDLAQERLAKLSFDRHGRILASTMANVFVFEPDGTPVAVLSVADGGPADFHLWIGVDVDNKLWTQFYRGKEVAYTAYALEPG